MSSILGRPFTVGSHYPANKKTEIYKQESDKWETLPDFPFAKVNVENYGIASTHSKGSTSRFSNVLEFRRSPSKVVFSYLVGFMTATGISSCGVPCLNV